MGRSQKELRIRGGRLIKNNACFLMGYPIVRIKKKSAQKNICREGKRLCKWVIEEGNERKKGERCERLSKNKKTRRERKKRVQFIGWGCCRSIRREKKRKRSLTRKKRGLQDVTVQD